MIAGADLSARSSLIYSPGACFSTNVPRNDNEKEPRSDEKEGSLRAPERCVAISARIEQGFMGLPYLHSRRKAVSAS